MRSLSLAVTVSCFFFISDCSPDNGYKKCRERGSPVFGRMRILLHRPAGIVVLYSCNPGYQRLGHLYSICIHGNWTSPLPSCISEFSGEVNDGAKQDQGVLVSLEELPTTKRIMTQKHSLKKEGTRKKKRKRKRKFRKMEFFSTAANTTTLAANLDMSCLLSSLGQVPKFVRPPQVPNSIGPKFLRKKTGKLKYLVAVYRCRPGYKLHSSHSRSLGCQNGKWVGRMPICLPRRVKIGCMNSGCDHDCKEVAGKPTCFCFKGFYQLGKSCIDINECSTQNGGCKSTCHNTPGSFFCGCKPGFRLTSDHFSCIDVNECLSRNGHGPCQGQCTNVEGGYHCSCDPVPGTRLADDGVTCHDIDECSDAEFRLNCSHSCVNTLGSAFCVCPSGYQLGPDWRSCQDVDECTSHIAECIHSCTNTPGSFMCSCNSGYILAEDQFSCVELIECSDLAEDSLCSPVCQNSTETYNCSCPATDFKSCKPLTDLCAQKNCPQGCVVKNGQANCVCDDGYVLTDDLTCSDVDECTEGKDGCSHYCVNEEGSFSCTCPKNMILHFDVKLCKEVKCDFNMCPYGCYIDDGVVSCDCPKNYRKVNSSCEDVDECLLDGGNCSQLCRNTEGGYDCFCNEGFYLDEDQKSCIDINECEQKHICSEHLCINSEGGYLCKCLPGFSKVEGTDICEDINECGLSIDEGSPVCSHFCINSLGTFHCECPYGFVLGGDLRSCEDIDECFENNEIITKCSHICINEMGSYHCKCPQGFTFKENNFTCIKSNACDINNGGCSHICTDNYGDFPICECPEHFEMAEDNITCLEIALCEKGYIFQFDLNTCVDIDECLSNNGNCSHQCVNTKGSFYCTCAPGYQTSAQSQDCTDIDECRESSNICDQVCVNTEGSFRCECFNGYILSEDGVKCFDINECLEELPCSHICINTDGSFKCQCKEGFVLTSDEKFCEDVDECFLNISKCSQICHNNEGGFSCECYPEFELINESQCIKKNNTESHDSHTFPFITCIPELRLILPPNEKEMMVHIPQPVTNMDWEKYVSSNPSWGKLKETILPYGISTVQFSAVSPSSDQVASCNITIHIKDLEKPKISTCPDDVNVTLKSYEGKATVMWQEPIITDNVHVARVFQSQKSGNTFTKGRHLVTYVAIDSSNNIGICQFTVTVSNGGP